MSDIISAGLRISSFNLQIKVLSAERMLIQSGAHQNTILCQTIPDQWCNKAYLVVRDSEYKDQGPPQSIGGIQ